MSDPDNKGRDQPAPRPETPAELRERVLATKRAIDQSHPWQEQWHLSDFIEQLMGRR